VSGEPGFLHRAAGRAERQEEVTFICVPILLDQSTAGTLAVEMRVAPERDSERMVKVLRIAAAMISQALRIQRLIDLERQRLVEENTQLREELRERYEFNNIVGNSGPMRQVYEQVAQVVGTTATVLVRGESGTGKELIAHALHHHSPRAGKPFIRVNCAALPETLVESELFGYERGAFTGAHARRKGRFEQADGGTLFLDEIGELSPATQAKLLRVLQEREFERLGGNETVQVDVRLITATSKDLEKALADGAFREDLYYRMNVFTICVPPLRERKSDVLLLADHFVAKYARVHSRSIKRISTPAIDMMMSYHWPGNVRELENTIERAVLVADGDVIHGADGGGVRHGRLALAERGRGDVREQPDPGRAQEHSGESCARRATAEHDRADPQLQGPALRNRSGPIPGLSTPSPGRSDILGPTRRPARRICRLPRASAPPLRSASPS
jgi:Nif-specific regulatory protein